MYFDMQNPNLMSISVGQNRKPSIIRKIRIFRIMKDFRIEFTKKYTSAVHLLIKSYLMYLVSPAAKKVEVD